MKEPEMQRPVDFLIPTPTPPVEESRPIDKDELSIPSYNSMSTRDLALVSLFDLFTTSVPFWGVNRLAMAVDIIDLLTKNEIDYTNSKALLSEEDYEESIEGLFRFRQYALDAINSSDYRKRVVTRARYRRDSK